MVPDQLTRAGTLLFGDRWCAPLARELGRSEKTVRRWTAGTSPVPEWANLEIRELLDERCRAIALLQAETS